MVIEVVPTLENHSNLGSWVHESDEAVSCCPGLVFLGELLVSVGGRLGTINAASVGLKPADTAARGHTHTHR